MFFFMFIYNLIVIIFNSKYAVADLKKLEQYTTTTRFGRFSIKLLPEPRSYRQVNLVSIKYLLYASMIIRIFPPKNKLSRFFYSNRNFNKRRKYKQNILAVNFNWHIWLGETKVSMRIPRAFLTVTRFVEMVTLRSHLDKDQ